MDLVSLVLYVLPAYFANGAPVLLGGGRPVDAHFRLWDGRRLFGDSKTWRGLVAGISVGVLAGFLLAYLLPVHFLPFLAFHEKMGVSALLAVGTMVGDLLGSFIKRRMNLPPGAPFFVTDQLLFIAMALAFSSVVFLPSYADILVVFLLTFILHILTNITAHHLNLKRVPW